MGENGGQSTSLTIHAALLGRPNKVVLRPISMIACIPVKAMFRKKEKVPDTFS